MDRLDQRAIFHEEDRILEIDLSDLVLETSADVDRVYDMLERRVAGTGRRWFFLINYLNCHIFPEVWVDYANRGKRFNLQSSLGTVRFNTPEETGAEIERRAGTDEFEANLHANRAAALEKLSAIRAEYYRLHPLRKPPTDEELAVYESRIGFDHERGFIDFDFSDFIFADSRIVNDFYDVLEREIAGTGREKWYFLVNYRNCVLYPEAWIAFANRGKKLNLAHSLGSVRYAASEATADEIRARAEREDFDANLCHSRDEGIAKIEALKAAAAAARA